MYDKNHINSEYYNAAERVVASGVYTVDTLNEVISDLTYLRENGMWGHPAGVPAVDPREKHLRTQAQLLHREKVEKFYRESSRFYIEGVNDRIRQGSYSLDDLNTTTTVVTNSSAMSVGQTRVSGVPVVDWDRWIDGEYLTLQEHKQRNPNYKPPMYVSEHLDELYVLLRAVDAQLDALFRQVQALRDKINV